MQHVQTVAAVAAAQQRKYAEAFQQSVRQIISSVVGMLGAGGPGSNAALQAAFAHQPAPVDSLSPLIGYRLRSVGYADANASCIALQIVTGGVVGSAIALAFCCLIARAHADASFGAGRQPLSSLWTTLIVVPSSNVGLVDPALAEMNQSPGVSVTLAQLQLLAYLPAFVAVSYAARVLLTSPNPPPASSLVRNVRL